MKKLHPIVYSLVVGFITMAHAPVQTKWTREMYAKHDYKSFAQLPMAHQPIDGKNIDYALLNAAIFYATNWQRDMQRQKPLKYSAALEKAAFEHSKDMIRLNFFSHTSPVQGKETYSKRIAAEGISNSYTGENISYRSHIADSYLNQAKKIVLGWMNSPGHRRNILNGSYQYIGCGAYTGKFDGWANAIVATQNFSATDAPPSQEVVIDYR
ncbi:CAP domain-containing protein [Rhodoflexus caldus]|uniref:CAP domain-containing protein n=1 Tax=Rhodoflexus caldus TaxID=2891236 RepID=UPI002029DF7A|nr:CAP domain-containing protein [Rhodoflexus caldus]